MSRPLLLRGLVLLASMVGLLVGCSSSSPTEGDLPKTKVATPEDLGNLQKELLQKKVVSGVAPKSPPGVNIPRQ